jgi:hypothetical protein
MSVRLHGLFLSLVCAASLSHAAGLPPPDPERPLWLRTPAVSPEGSRIAFAHGGGSGSCPPRAGRRAH